MFTHNNNEIGTPDFMMISSYLVSVVDMATKQTNLALPQAYLTCVN